MALDLGKARRMETDAAIAGERRVRNEEVLCCIVLCRAASCCVVLCRAVSCCVVLCRVARTTARAN